MKYLPAYWHSKRRWYLTPTALFIKHKPPVFLSPKQWDQRVWWCNGGWWRNTGSDFV